MCVVTLAENLRSSMKIAVNCIDCSVHPVIQVPNQLVGAPLGTDVVLECHVEASPKSINYWVRDTGEPNLLCSNVQLQLFYDNIIVICELFRR